MKSLVVFVIGLAIGLVTAAVVPNTDFEAPIIRSDYEISPEGAFQYAYETGNGIYSQARGEIKNPDAEYPALVITGGYKYVAPDGTPIEISYVADEEGFKPVGSHLPVPPPIPEAIARSLAYIEAHPPPKPVAKAAPALLG